MKRIVSGIQPTGFLHLGNYLGSIKQWVELQKEYESFLFLADLHAITVPQDPEALRRSVRVTAATYIACGIDPNKSAIFAQSTVHEHAELGWILNCMTPIGWLNRMVQFKDKAGKDKEKASLGLYSYPVLQAADVLLYKADIVPVGEDQKQHIELARDIAGAFNRRVEQDYFPLPEPRIMGVATRIMSLRDGTKKMSKSDPSEYSRIHLNDDADTILKKFQKAKTDALPEISYDEENRPDLANLINIYSAITTLSKEQIVENYIGKGFAAFKKELAENVIEHLRPITQKLNDLLEDTVYIDNILKQGAMRARSVASIHLKEVKELLGFLVI
jgi:tryptophanyl-tRNA synthetase